MSKGGHCARRVGTNYKHIGIDVKISTRQSVRPASDIKVLQSGSGGVLSVIQTLYRVRSRSSQHVIIHCKPVVLSIHFFYTEVSLEYYRCVRRLEYT